MKMSDNFCSYVSEEFASSFRNVKILDAENNKLGQQLNGDTEGVTFKQLKKLLLSLETPNCVQSVA